MSKTLDTLPAENASTELTRFNAFKHGVLSRYTVLPWEDAEDYKDLTDALFAEHAPVGPTEQHLVEELAGIIWRKRRLRLAEAAALHRGLGDTLDSFRRTVEVALVHLDANGQSERIENAIRATAHDTAHEIAEMEKDEEMTRSAIDLLDSKRKDAYEAALAALREDTRAWWNEMLACDPDDLDRDEEPYKADIQSLRLFLDRHITPWFDNRRRELQNRSLIRDQAFGEALDPARLERLGRYEVHLDRKMERTLAMLIRLAELREVDTSTR